MTFFGKVFGVLIGLVISVVWNLIVLALIGEGFYFYLFRIKFDSDTIMEAVPIAYLFIKNNLLIDYTPLQLMVMSVLCIIVGILLARISKKITEEIPFRVH